MLQEIYNENSVLGSSKWLDIEGHNDESARQLMDSLFLIGNITGEKKGRNLVGLKNHMLSIGPTRSGKNSALATPALLYNKRSVIVIDPKAELAYLTAERRREMGQRTFILDPFDEFKNNYGDITGEVEKLTNFNPFSIINDYYINDFIHYIAESIIITQGSDTHWSDSCLEFTEGMLAWMVEDP